MTENIEEYINLTHRFKELKCPEPGSYCFLPENIADAKSIKEFIYTDNTQTIRKLFKLNNLPEDRLESTAASYRQRRSIDWYSPALFIGFTLWSQNSDLISVGLNVLSDYITDFFKGSFGKKNVKIDIIVETTPKKTYKKISYEGSAEGLKNLPEIINSLK